MSALDFIPTRQAGLDRLAEFRPAMGRKYALGRNHDLGPDNRSNVSCLSPWIRHRLLSERELVEAALESFSLEEAEKFVQEVCWRSYFKGWLEQRPAVWTRYCRDRDEHHQKLRDDAALYETYRSAIEGRTGIDGFDDWAAELTQTGYLHNHARMWFASIWIFTLKLPWELGADFFLRHLMDGDPASNTLSWRWIGGLHTQGKTYLADRTNIEKLTGGRFSPDGLAKEARPVDGFENPERRPLPQAGAVPEKAFCLLLTESDLSAETFIPADAPVAGIIGATSANWRSVGGAGHAARRFTDAAMRDGMARAGRHFGVEARRIDESADLAEALSHAARAHNTDTIVTPWVPAGWVADRLLGAETQLQAEGLRIVHVRRDWDDVFWPYATRGYFKLKKKIPECLERLGLVGASAFN